MKKKRQDLSESSVLFRKWIIIIISNSGDLTPAVYEEKCEFADPAGSFKGLARFKRNCTNFGSLIEKSNMKLMKWENFEVLFFSQLLGDFFRRRRKKYLFLNFHRHMGFFFWQEKGVGHWKFSCVMSFPWKPILSGIQIHPATFQKILPLLDKVWNFNVIKEKGHNFFCLLMVINSWEELLFFTATGYTEYYFDAESGKICR